MQSNRPKVFLGKGVLKLCCKFTGEHPYRGVISITPFSKNTSGRLLLVQASVMYELVVVKEFGKINTGLLK